MSYLIRIGNAEAIDEESFTIHFMERHDAPRCYDPVGRCNQRHPSSTAMRQLARITGLEGLFGELIHDTGCIMLMECHVEKVEQALARWRETSEAKHAKRLGVEDDILDRLVWFQWWMRWALDECEQPGVMNG